MSKKYRCKFISHGLFFEYDHLRHCHLSVHAPEAKRLNRIVNYTGPKDKIDWEKIYSTKKELVSNLREGNFPPFCKGCSWIEEFEDEEQYKSDYDEYLNMIWICHFNHCNCNCTYCCDYENIKNKTTTKGYNIYPVLEEILKKGIYRAKDPDAHISFGLGEPTILNNFEQIIELFAKHGLEKFAVYTNGIKFSKIIAKLLANPDIEMRVVVSLDSGSREVYKKVKNVDCFNKVCDNIKEYMKAAKKATPRDFQVKYIIIPGVNDTKEEIDRWFDICVNKLGVESLSADIEEEWFIAHRDNIPQELVDLCKYIKDKTLEKGLDFFFFDRAQILKID